MSMCREDKIMQANVSCITLTNHSGSLPCSKASEQIEVRELFATSHLRHRIPVVLRREQYSVHTSRRRQESTVALVLVAQIPIPMLSGNV